MKKIKMNVLAVHAFDPAALSVYMRKEVPDFGEIVEISQIQGGVSNPTLSITAECGSLRRRYVLRKKPPGNLLASAHQIDREYRVIKALSGTNVPVPDALLYCADKEVIGTEFYVMSFLEGRIFRDARLPGVTLSERKAIYGDLNRTLARIHQVDVAAVGLSDYGRPGNYFERQIARWTSQYRSAQTETIPAMEELIAELPLAIPVENSVSIAHGDFRLENVMFDPVEPKVIAVLDWELSTIGHPLADLAYNCFLWHSQNESWGTLRGIDLPARGIPAESEYIAAYCHSTGRGSIDHWEFYMAFAIFRLASIVQGVFKRSLQGNLATDTTIINETKNLADQAIAIFRN